MTKKRKSIWDLGGKGFIPDNLGIKMPKQKPIKFNTTFDKAMQDIQRQNAKAWKQAEKDIQRSTKIDISMPKIRATPKQHSSYLNIPTFTQKRVNYNQSYNLPKITVPTLGDIIKELEQRRAEKERRENIRKIRMQEYAKRVITQDIVNSIYVGQNTTNHELRKQISNLNQQVNENTEKIEKVSDGLDAIKDRLDDLESYKKSLENGITSLIKRQEIEPSNPAIITALNNVMDEKKKTEDEIKQIKDVLSRVVQEQKTDKPFVEWWKKATEDSKDNPDTI